MKTYKTEYFLDGMPLELSNGWQSLADYMDDDIREGVHADLSPCTRTEFLSEYIRRDPNWFGTSYMGVVSIEVPVDSRAMSEVIKATTTWHPMMILEDVQSIADLWEEADEILGEADADQLVNDIQSGWIEFCSDGAIVWEDGK